MDRQSLRVLEFPQIQKILQMLTSSEPGRQQAAEIRPSTDRAQIEIWLAQVTELKEYLQIGKPLPIGGIVNLGRRIDRVAATGEVLPPQDLLEVAATLETTRTLRGLVGQCRPEYPQLAEVLENLQPLPDLERKIGHTFDSRGRFRDEASPELARIRKEIGELRKRLHGELAQILEQQALQKTLQDKLINVRNDRLVIPLRSDARGALEGIVHDTSQSGATSYVEPLVVVPLNNRLTKARSQEREEEARILRELTDGVMTAAAVIRFNEKWLGFIDCLQAKVRMSNLLGGREPILNTGERIRLLQASHPILALQERAEETSALPVALKEMVLASEFSENRTLSEVKVVPIDLQLDEDQRTLIISGANTGGKTVSLKTLGLLVAMTQAGMHIPVAEGSELPTFDDIFAEIGDEQDVRAHLSTFSAKIQRLIEMLNQADTRSLVLLDEIGTGTDPAEGAALALAVLDELRHRGPFMAVTTHYHLVKAYGIVNEGVENVSVAFDGESGRPAYRLLYGYPGTSNALQIATDLGMPREVVEAARVHLDPDQSRTIGLIRQLGEACARTETQWQGLKAQEEELLSTQDDLARERERLVQSRAEILNEARQKASGILDQSEKELKAAIARFQQQGMKGAMAARKRVQQIKEELNTALEPLNKHEGNITEVLAEGQSVRLRGLSGTGIVLKIKEQGRRAEIQIGQKRVEVDTDALEFPPILPIDGKNVAKNNGIRVIRERTEGCLQQLRLVGLRVDEAIPLLDKAIDQAILEGYDRIHVIHGHGTGRLRNAVQEFLANHTGVKGFHGEDPRRGGSAITVVELMD